MLLVTQTSYSQTLEQLLAGVDPIDTIPTQTLKKLLHDIGPLEKQATPEQQIVIDLLRLRHLAILGDFDGSLKLIGKLDTPAVDPKYRIRAYTTAMVIHHVQGNFTEAFSLLNKAQQLLPWTD
ncbi:hypothetical protein, partial [Thiolapillus sp.]